VSFDSEIHKLNSNTLELFGNRQTATATALRVYEYFLDYPHHAVNGETGNLKTMLGHKWCAFFQQTIRQNPSAKIRNFGNWQYDSIMKDVQLTNENCRKLKHIIDSSSFCFTIDYKQLMEGRLYGVARKMTVGMNDINIQGIVGKKFSGLVSSHERNEITMLAIADCAMKDINDLAKLSSQTYAPAVTYYNYQTISPRLSASRPASATVTSPSLQNRSQVKVKQNSNCCVIL
jgi:hypothetical protein